MQRFLGAGCPAAFRSKDVQAPSGNRTGSGRVVAIRKELCQASDFLSLGPPVVGHGGPLYEKAVSQPRSCRRALRTSVVQSHATAREQSQKLQSFRLADHTATARVSRAPARLDRKSTRLNSSH